MSDLIIKGMDMPSSCQLCKLKRFAGNRVLSGCKPEVLYECPFCDGLFALENKRQPSCKLEQFPTHGRLIDADVLLRKCQKISTQAWKMKLHADVEITMNQFIDFVKQAPTVIEAEE